MSIDFKASHYQKNVILYVVFFLCVTQFPIGIWKRLWPSAAFTLTIRRWVVKYSPDIAKDAQMKNCRQLDLGVCLLGILRCNALPSER